MRALLVTDIFPPKTGGSGRWFWEMYRRLPNEDIVVAAGEDPRQAAFDCSNQLSTIRLPLEMRTRGIRSFANFKHYLRSAWRLRTLIKRHNVKMVHCGRCLPEGVMARLAKSLTGTPYICYVHGEDVNVASTSRELTLLTKWVFNSADYLIANSKNTRQILIDNWGVPGARIHLLYPGVDTKQFCPMPQSLEVRSTLGWGNRRVVLTVGRLQKRKGQDFFILALNELRHKMPDILYCIAGDGDEAPNLHDLVGKYSLTNHVQFLGEVSDEKLVACYQQCDLFALPNRTIEKDIEGFGMVLLEAQACGKPVIAGNSGGTAETMRVPETGRIVNCEDPSQIAGVVGELLGNPALLQKMGTHARRWVCDHFDWSAISRQALKLFTNQSETLGKQAENPFPVSQPA